MTEMPTENTAVRVTDAKGRLLEVRLLTALEQLDLLEAAGANAGNAAWLGTALMAFSVRAIDGVPRPSPINRRQVRDAVAVLGTVGMSAVQKGVTTRVVRRCPESVNTMATM
jgi:hypothetical protein